MAKREGWVVIGDLRGGRNGTDPPLSLPDNQCVEALNVDHYEGTLARKRGGSTGITDTGGTAFAVGMQSLIRHVPGAAETAAELWGIDGNVIFKRMTGGSSWANVTLDDNLSGSPQDVIGASLNGKLFLAYDTTQDRLHVYDPNVATPRVRRFGLRQDGIGPLAADNATAGTYAATARYYRERWIQTNYTIPQSVTSTNNADGLRNAASNTRLAQGFQISTAGIVYAVDAIIYRGTGSPVGNVWMTIESDTTGSPSGTVLQTSQSLSTLALDTGGTIFVRFLFTAPAALSASTQYHFVLYGDYAIAAGAFASWRGNTANQNSTGVAKRYDGATWGTGTTCVDFSYKAYVITDGSVGPKLYRRSEPSKGAKFTPDGAHTAATVTQPTVPGEGETHWELEASTDDATYYALYAYNNTGYLGDAIPIATTTASDTATTAQYPSGPVSDPIGMYALMPSVKFLLTDGNRLLGAGANETGGKNARIFFTPVLGAADKADDERVPNQTNQKNWVDVNENDGGGITALMGPLNGVVLAAKYRQLQRLIPTGDVLAPYLPRKVSEWVGCVGAKAWCVGRDDAGQPCIYFLSTQGPYRYGTSGLQYMGRDNEDIWSTLSLGATGVVAWVLYHPDKHQVWWHIAVSAGNDPSVRMVFDVLLGRVTAHNEVRGGWYKHTGDAPAARCGCLFANTLGASMSRDLKPYIGRASGTAVQKCDTADTSDNGTLFQAYVTTKPIRADAGTKLGVRTPSLVAKVSTGVTIALTLVRDYGLETPTAATTLLTAAGSETRVTKKFEAQMSGADVIQPQIGDSAAVASAWTLDELSFPLDRQEIR